jgi:amino acid transporter
VSLIVSTLFGGLAYMALQSTAGTVFGYLANLTAAAGLMTWWSICFCYIRFHKGLKVQGIERSSLPYASKLNKGAFAAWYAIILISVILFFSGFAVFLSGNWSAANFVTNYLPIFLFPVLFLFWKFFKKTRFVRAAEMDFYSGLEEVEADSYDEPPPKHVVEKVWRWVM